MGLDTTWAPLRSGWDGNDREHEDTAQAEPSRL